MSREWPQDYRPRNYTFAVVVSRESVRITHLVLGMLIFNLRHQKHTMSFAVPNLALRILAKLPLSIVLCMEVNLAVLIFGSNFGHV